MVLSVARITCLRRGLEILLGPERLPFVPESLYANCFLEGAKFLLCCVPLSERPPFCKGLGSMTEGV